MRSPYMHSLILTLYTLNKTIFINKSIAYRDVNCISCDAQVVMAMESGPCMPGNKPLHATLSMKPYLCYELGMIQY